MRKATRTLAIVALTTSLMSSCSSPTMPATTPTMPAETLHIYANTATFPLVVDLTTAYNELNSLSTFDTRSANYQTLMNWLKQDEMPFFVSNHLQDAGMWAAPIGQDGIVIITHPENPVTDLTTDQLRQIYQGKITNWEALGGISLPITVFSRENGSGTRAEFEDMVMGRRSTTGNALIASSTENMVRSIAQQPGSIGYISLGYLDDTVKAVSINGIAPSQLNIFDNLYPLRSTIFIIGLEAPTLEYQVFIGWVQSAEGQAVVAKKYVPLLTIPQFGS